MARLSSVVVLTAGTILLGQAALADGIADGNAGLQALDKGDYDQAIALFTHALTDRRLAVADREFAYVSRAKAELAKGQQVAAAADFRTALRLKPDDADAKDGLQQASAPARPAPRWGVLADLAGKYWVMNPDKPAGYARAEWDKSGRALLVEIAEKSILSSTVYREKYQLDPSAGVVFAIVVGGKAYYGDAQVEDGKLVENSFVNSTPTRETMTSSGPGQFTDVVEKYKNGVWSTASTYAVREVSKDAVAQVRWAKKLTE
jgi:tetratricopeptide (TPR) repeat protein